MHIIALQLFYVIFILLFTIGAVVVLYHDIINGVVAAVASALTATSSVSGSVVLSQLEAARAREIAAIVTLIIAATVVFGFLVVRHALEPTRNALISQKQFIGNIAHELRTPLAIIKANTEVLLLEENLDNSVRSSLSSSVEELDRISDIMNNLLSLNVLMRRPERISFALIDVKPMVERIAEKLSPAGTDSPTQVEVQIPEGTIAWANATALEQIITNILKNAIQHTPSGRVAVTAAADNHHALELSVQDTGKGIEREHLARIFEPFYRGDRARTRIGGTGSGLGLAIVSELVKLHHGRVDVLSDVGHGTTVSIWLHGAPVKRPRSIPFRKSNEVHADFSKDEDA